MVIYTVKRSYSGQWEVANAERTVASFTSKDDAVEYAHRLAEYKDVAQVKVES